MEPSKSPQGLPSVLEFRQVSCRGSGMVQLDLFSLEVRPGEVHAVLGDHRAGKSLLASVASGQLEPTSGEILLEGEGLRTLTPRSAIRLGIRVLFQDLQLIPGLRALEHILAGRYQIGAFADRKSRQARDRILAFARAHGLVLDTGRPVSALPRSMQHAVELLRVFGDGPRVVVLDEPAGRFNPEELDHARTLVREATARGAGVLYLTGSVNEVLAIADRVSILRAGRVVTTQPVQDLDRSTLIGLAYSPVDSREDLLRKNIELYRYRQCNEGILAGLPLGTVILDHNGALYLVNPMVHRILGTHGPGLPSARALVRLLPRGFLGTLNRARRARRPEVWDQVDLADGKVLRVALVPLRTESGNYLGTMILAEDRSQELKVQEYLLQSERIASVAELAAGVAHEVNNPLGIMHNFVELMKRRKPEAYISEKLDLMDSEILRIHAIVGSLLNFSRPDDASMVVLDLGGVVDETVRLLSHEAHQRSIALEWKPPADGLLVRGNANRLKQVLINLSINAFEAQGPGGRVRLTLAGVDDQVLLAVSDEGPGMGEDQLADLFRPFVTTKTGGKNAGLGLSICHHICEAHGGTIGCRSTLGAGTTFEVRLPRAPGGPAPG